MKLINQVVVVVGAGVVSLCAGTLLTSNFKNAGQTITLATLLSLPTVGGLHLFLDGKATKRINEAENKASKAERKAREAESGLTEAIANLNQNQCKLTELSQKNSELSNELASVRKVLEDVNIQRDQLLVYANEVIPFHFKCDTHS
jgi:TolA-binding protein